MNREAIGGLLLFVVFLIIGYDTVVYPVLHAVYVNVVKPLTDLVSTPSLDILPFTMSIIRSIIDYALKLFSNPFAVAILLFISLALLVLEMKW
jgi:hypothetical protein